MLCGYTFFISKYSPLLPFSFSVSSLSEVVVVLRWCYRLASLMFTEAFCLIISSLHFSHFIHLLFRLLLRLVVVFVNFMMDSLGGHLRVFVCVCVCFCVFVCVCCLRFLFSPFFNLLSTTHNTNSGFLLYGHRDILYLKETMCHLRLSGYLTS